MLALLREAAGRREFGLPVRIFGADDRFPLGALEPGLAEWLAAAGVARREGVAPARLGVGGAAEVDGRRGGGLAGREQGGELGREVAAQAEGGRLGQAIAEDAEDELRVLDGVADERALAVGDAAVERVLGEHPVVWALEDPGGKWLGQRVGEGAGLVWEELLGERPEHARREPARGRDILEPSTPHDLVQEGNFVHVGASAPRHMRGPSHAPRAGEGERACLRRAAIGASFRTMEELFTSPSTAGGPRCVFVADPRSGLRAIVALDDTTLGPAVGGVRTMRYPSADAALADVLSLARAMTRKCSLAGLDAGGGKAVVLLGDGVDRQKAFARLGQVVEELGGVFRTAGDLGTTAADLEVMAEHTRYVHTDERGLAAAVARGLLRCIEACASARGVPLAGLSVAVQGAGAIGASAARLLAEAGLRIVLADVDVGRAEAVARTIPGARVTPADRVLAEDVDILAPCAVGGVLTAEVVRGIHAWAVCGAANNVLASPEVAGLLAARGVLHVPDPIASAGAVIDGIGLSVMGLADRTPLIDRLGETARLVLAEAKASGRTPMEVAEARALARIEAARAAR